MFTIHPLTSSLSCSRFKSLNDINSNHFLLFHSGTRWLSFLLDFMAVIMTLMVSLFVVLISNDYISPALKGLAMSYTIQVHLDTFKYNGGLICKGHISSGRCLCVFQLTGMLQFVVRQATEVEARFNSVERLQEYITVRLQDYNHSHTCCRHKSVDSFLILSPPGLGHSCTEKD